MCISYYDSPPNPLSHSSRYEVEMAAYVPKSQQNQAKSSAAKTAGGPLTKAEKLAKKEKRLKKKKMKDPNAPKRAL